MGRTRQTTQEIKPSDGDGYADQPLPDSIGHQARVLTGAAASPRTLGALTDLFAQNPAFQPQDGNFEEMLITDESPHKITLPDRTVHAYCFLDALGLAFLVDEPVGISTTSPTSGATIELEASSRWLRGAQEGMVVSFGFGRDMLTDPSAFEQKNRDEVLAGIHAHGCPTMNLFEDRHAYDAWTRQAEAVTMPIALPHALAMVRDFVEPWNV